MAEQVLPAHCDMDGVAYSGQIMSWIDVCAGIAAKTHAESACVTASVDAVHFLQPIFTGEVVVLKAQVNRAWNTSMEVGVCVEAENMNSGERRFCCLAYLTFVAMSGGEKRRVGAVLPETEQDLQNFNSAELRRQKRISLVKQNGPDNDNDTFTDYNDTHNIHDGHSYHSYDVPRPSGCSRTSSLQIIMPQHANSLGITFGGHIIRSMEQCAQIAAHRHIHPPHYNASTSPLPNKEISHNMSTLFRTASIDSLTFQRPSKVGDILLVCAKVSRVWRSSMEIYITVYSSNFDMSSNDLSNSHNKWVMTNDGYLTVVAVRDDESFHREDHHLTDAKFKYYLPQVLPETEQDLSRFDRADDRRNRRLEERNNIMNAYYNDANDINRDCPTPKPQ